MKHLLVLVALLVACGGGDTNTGYDPGGFFDTSMLDLGSSFDVATLDVPGIEDEAHGSYDSTPPPDIGPDDVSTVEDTSDPDDSGSTDDITVPPLVLHGSYTINNAFDVVFITKYTGITGNLYVNDAKLTGLLLPNLITLGEDLNTLGSSLVTLDLPTLKTIGGDLRSGAKVLNLPALVSIKGTLKNINPSTVDFSSLQTVGDIYIGVDATGTFELPSLTGVNEFRVRWTDIALISCPKLTFIGNLIVDGNQSLQSIGFHSLTSATKLNVGSDNPQLYTIDFSTLSKVEDGIYISGNMALAQCLVDAIKSQLEATGGLPSNSTLTGNNNDCTCEVQGGKIIAHCP